MKNIIYFVFCFIIFSCASSKQHPIQDNTFSPLLSLRENSIEDFNSILFITSEEQFGQLMGRINATRMPGIQFGPIDFQQEQLLVFNLSVDKEKNDLELIQINQNRIEYQKIHNADYADIPNDYKLIKLYKIPFSTHPPKVIEIKQ